MQKKGKEHGLSPFLLNDAFYDQIRYNPDHELHSLWTSLQKKSAAELIAYFKTERDQTKLLLAKQVFLRQSMSIRKRAAEEHGLEEDLNLILTEEEGLNKQPLQTKLYFNFLGIKFRI